MNQDKFQLKLTLQQDYEFEADFGLDAVPNLLLDEPPPLGSGTGPNAARVLAAAVGNCLSASLLYCLRKARLDVEGMTTVVDATLARNEKGRLRIAGIAVKIAPTVPPDQRERMSRCLDLFEDFCIVTESVRQGIPVEVQVTEAESAPLPAPAF